MGGIHNMEEHDLVQKLNITMEEIVKPTLIRIEDKATKTNGNIRDLQRWRAYMTGGLTVICVVLLPLVFMVIQNYLSTVENQQMIRNLQANIIQTQ